MIYLYRPFGFMTKYFVIREHPKIENKVHEKTNNKINFIKNTTYESNYSPLFSLLGNTDTITK